MAAVIGQHWMYVTSGLEFYADASKGQKTRIVLLVADRLSFLSVTNIYILSICDFQAHLTVWKVRPQSAEIVVRNVMLLW